MINKYIKYNRINLLIFIITICLYNNAFSVPINRAKKKDLINIYFLNIDRGECILIDLFGREKILIDTGPKEKIEYLIPKKKKRKRKKRTSRGLFTLIKKLKIKILDFVIISYPHKNYIGNLPAILKYIKVKNVLDAAYAMRSVEYVKALQTIEKKNIKYHIARKGYNLNIKGVKFKVIHPEEENNENYKEAYEKAIVLKMTYKNHSFLFTGAIGNKTINRILETPKEFKNCFLKLPYNYKGEKIVIKLIRLLKPKAVYIPKKIYKKGIMNYLLHNNIPAYTPLKTGNITIKTNGQDYFAVK